MTMCAAAAASKASHIFHAVKRQLGSPEKAGVPNLAGAEICKASRSLVQHQAPLQLMHWPVMPRVQAFQARIALLSCLGGTCCNVMLLRHF